MKKEKISTLLLIIFLGNLAIVVGTNMFTIGAHLLPTGLTGFATEISTLLKRSTGINLNYTPIYIALNIPIIIAGYFKVGKKFIFKTLLSLIVFSFLAAIIPQKSLITVVTSGDKLISAIVGAILIGVGIGLLLRVGSSSGGKDVIGLYFSLYKGKSFGLYSLIMDFVVIMLGIVIYQNITVGAISLISLYITNQVIDLIHNSQEKRILLIVTKNPNEVTEAVYKNILRGITVIESTGGYSKERNATLMISISNGEVYHAINVIKEADENAFINVINAAKVVGNFENPYQKKL